eukprot:Nk52_evm76s2367 gene=Nk52_evmTU76s2367
MAESVPDFIAGYIGGVLGIIVGQPLDTIKTRMQTQTQTQTQAHMQQQQRSLINNNVSKMAQQSGRGGVGHISLYYSSPWDCAQKTLQREGFQGFYKGMFAPILGVGVLNALLFGTFGTVSRLLPSPSPSSPSSLSSSEASMALSPVGRELLNVYLAGSVSGAVCSVVTTPTELIKCRIQVLSQGNLPDGSGRGGMKKKLTPLQCAKELFAANGFSGFYRGFWITVVRDTPSYGLYFFVYEGALRWFNSLVEGSAVTNSSIPVLMAGGLAGSISWASIYPLDVVKSRVQSVSCLKSSSKLQLALTLKTIISKEGWRGLFSGFTPTVLRAFPTNAATFFGYEYTLGWVNSLNGFGS